MKIIFIIIAFVIFSCIRSVAQDSVVHSQIDFSPPRPLKAIVHFGNDSVLSGKIIAIKDDYVLLSEKISGNNYNPDYRSIEFTQIKTMKIKRNKFLFGLGAGALVGGLIGYGIGALTYEYDNSSSESSNKESKNLRGWAGAAIAGVPSALLGALIGSVAIRVRFNIDGDKNKMKKMVHSLLQF